MTDSSALRQHVNTVRLAGKLLERDAMRLTPARIPVVGFRIRHESRQTEAGGERDVMCEMEARAVGDLAQQINALPVGINLVIQGFLGAKSSKSPKPVVHVTEIELLEGMNHGF